MGPSCIAELHCSSLAVTAAEFIGEPLALERRNEGIEVNPAALENQIFPPLSATINPRPFAAPNELTVPVSLMPNLFPSALAWIGRRAAKRRKDGKKRRETLETVDADW